MKKSNIYLHRQKWKHFSIFPRHNIEHTLYSEWWSTSRDSGYDCLFRHKQYGCWRKPGSGPNLEFTTSVGPEKLNGSCYELIVNSATNYHSSLYRPYQTSQLQCIKSGSVFSTRDYYHITMDKIKLRSLIIFCRVLWRVFSVENILHMLTFQQACKRLHQQLDVNEILKSWLSAQ